MQRGVDLQEVLRVSTWRDFIPKGAHKSLSNIENCRTAKLGYHAYRCQEESCKTVHLQYHGCRDRHCNHCGSLRARTWIEDRMRELLPIKYFHVVFTIPDELKPLFYLNQKPLYDLLFKSVAHCLLTLGKDPKYLGAQLGFISVLHTWGQQLNYRPHIHCIVSGGGVDKHGKWHNLKKGKGKYLFPYDVMEKLYKGYLLEKINELVVNNLLQLPKNVDWKKLKNELYETEWIVYAKAPMNDKGDSIELNGGGAEQVIEYLGRYTQKVAISNHRILSIDGDKNVTFKYKDYKSNGEYKLLKIPADEFVKRFSWHLLPRGFMRVRHYGFMGNTRKKSRIARILDRMKLPQHPEKQGVSKELRFLEMYGSSKFKCPKCKKGILVLEYVSTRAGPNQNNENQYLQKFSKSIDKQLVANFS